MYAIITTNSTTSIPSNREVKLTPEEKAISRTDIHGNILYYNHTFTKISGYGKNELLGMPHSMLRHPDMPKAIFYVIWQNILSGIPTHAIIKNFTKEGDYYWLLIKFIVQKDNHNNIVSFLSHGTQAPKHAIQTVEPLYKNLLEHEENYDRDSSIKLLSSFLNSSNIATYNDYIISVSKKKKTGFFSSLKY